MQKKLLTAAIGATLAASVSLVQAGVTVGGHAQVEYYNATSECSVGVVNGGNGGIFSGTGVCAAANSRLNKATGLIDNARGRFWINADEDIGSMKALARYEFSVDVANSGQGAGNTAAPYDTTARTFDQRTREKYVGLAGGFGTVTLGNLHGVYKRLGGVRWDPFNATVLEARGNGGQSGGDVSATFAHNGFIPGAIKWESDKLLTQFVRLEVLLAPDSNKGTGTGNQGNGYDYQAGISIKPVKQLEIVVAHSNNKEQTGSGIGPNEDQKATKVGVRGSFGGSTVWLQHEIADINSSILATSVVAVTGATTDVAEARYTWLGFSQKFGNNEIVLQFARNDRNNTGGVDPLGVKAYYYNLGYLYNFSKTAKVWVGARKTDADAGLTNREATVFSAGMRKDF